MNGQEADTASHTLHHELKGGDGGLLLGGGFLPSLLNILNIRLHLGKAAHDDLGIEALGGDGKHGTIENDRQMDLIPAEADR